MALPLPNLDDRRWADLAEEGRSLIPRYAPAWTDHNVHDPGITQLELLAWVTEMQLYRLNRVPARHLRKFLALAGLRSAGPAPAETMLSFGSLTAGTSFVLPKGTQFESRTAVFATVRDARLSAITLTTLLLEDAAGALRDVSGEMRDGHVITLFGRAAYLGFSQIPMGVPVSLGFRLVGPGNDAFERRRLMEEAEAQVAACSPVTSRFSCPGAEVTFPHPVRLPKHHSAHLIWEVSAGPGTWQPVVVEDDTRCCGR
jgi:hypothetical protein